MDNILKVRLYTYCKINILILPLRRRDILADIQADSNSLNGYHYRDKETKEKFNVM